ncbi:mitochondrial inner-membrane-bound regulator-domain-containing protein [Aspergillus varians]
MLSQLSNRAGGLIRCQLLSSCRLNTLCPSLPQRGIFARYQNTTSDSSDSSDYSDNTRQARPSSQRTSNHRRRHDNKDKFESRRIGLDISALGKPGEVLVVRERKRRGFSRREAAQPKEDTSGLPLMLSDIEQDIGHFDSSVVAERIESFRLPYQPRDKLSPGDWEDLRSRLRPSFTGPQLSEYISKNRKGRDNDIEGSSTHHETSNLAEWRPGTSLFLEMGSVSQETVADRIAASQHIKGKELLIERLLRDCWKLGIANEIGQIDIRLPTHCLSLLIGSKFFSFEELANLHETTIDVTNSLGLVRVTGKQRSCESIREIIHDYTNRIQSEELNLVPPGDSKAKTLARTFTPDFLSWVSETYNVSFEQSSSQLPSRIYVLSENQANADNARRTLNLALDKARLPPVPFSTSTSASKLLEINDVDLGNAAPWHDREKPWFRLEMPESQKLAILPEYILNEHQSTFLDGLLKVLRQKSPSIADFGPDLEVCESMAATVGKCLFLRKPFLEETQASASQLGKMSLPRTFANDVPRVPRLLQTLTRQGAGSRSHRMRLAPSALHANVFPPLELEVVIAPDETGTHGDECVLRSAKAVLAESNVDYLLPEGVADIRFTRKLTHELLNRPHEIPSLDAILTDLRGRFQESMTSNSEVPLPTFTSVSLPGYLLQGADGELDSNGWATAEYMYLPVNDVHGTHVSQYAIRDYQLFYASYDGGPYNANTTTDLFLQTGSKDHGVSNTDASHSASSRQIDREEFNVLYNAACAVVSSLDLFE